MEVMHDDHDKPHNSPIQTIFKWMHTNCIRTKTCSTNISMHCTMHILEIVRTQPAGHGNA